MKHRTWGVLLLSGCPVVWAQQPQAPPPEPPGIEPSPQATPAAPNADPAAPRPEDVTSIDAIVKAFYEFVSGPAGTPRQWPRGRALYVPGARLVGFHVPPGESQPRVKVRDLQQYVDDSDAGMVRDGFHEKEVNRVLRRFGNVVQVFSTYETRQTPDGPVKERGVKSLDLFYDGVRWWIAAVLWDIERTDNPIPDSLQPWGLDCPKARAGGKKGGGKARPKKR